MRGRGRVRVRVRVGVRVRVRVRVGVRGGVRVGVRVRGRSSSSPWLKVCGLEESSSCIHAKSSTMALPMAKACRVRVRIGVRVKGEW